MVVKEIRKDETDFDYCVTSSVLGNKCRASCPSPPPPLAPALPQPHTSSQPSSVLPLPSAGRPPAPEAPRHQGLGRRLRAP